MASLRENQGWYWLSVMMPAAAIFAFLWDRPWRYLFCLVATILLGDLLLGEHVEADGEQKCVTGISAAVPAAFICLWLFALLTAVIRLRSVAVPEYSGFTAACGVLSAFAMAHIHEILHHDDKRLRVASDIALALAGYPHYRIVHDLHHSHVGDPRYGSTACLGLSLWRHVGNSLRLSLLAAFTHDRLRLAKGRKSRLIRAAVVYIATLGVFGCLGGARGILFYLGQSAISVFVVEAIGYIQHYGLVGTARNHEDALAWDVRFWLSNRLFVNNGLHTHHHLDQTRSYERLRLVGTATPAGYLHMFILALVPPFWFFVMNRHVEMFSRPASMGEDEKQE
ncbi:fatty acid desaturase [Paraburkholderia sp. EG287A]|uniref:fatty acid desaturase n=1 Tax=unclassified Paraburkholderia TaxID=2615204 RepID=UPI0034D1EB9B